MSKRGGAREGAGRKTKVKLFKDLSLDKKRKALMKHIKDEDIKIVIENMVQRAKNSDTSAKYLIDQLIGKALQSTDVTSGGEKVESFNDEQVDRIAARIAARNAKDGGS